MNSNKDYILIRLQFSNNLVLPMGDGRQQVIMEHKLLSQLLHTEWSTRSPRFQWDHYITLNYSAYNRFFPYMEATPNRTFPCMEATYPYAIKRQRKAVGGFGCLGLVLCLYGIRELA